jgi:hypothetical protein
MIGLILLPVNWNGPGSIENRRRIATTAIPQVENFNLQRLGATA